MLRDKPNYVEPGTGAGGAPGAPAQALPAEARAAGTGEQHGLARRRFLAQGVAALAAAPALGGLSAWFAPSSNPPSTGAVPADLEPHDPWPDHPVYKFAMIADRTGSQVYLATRTGANDACSLLGTTFTWNGSASGAHQEMVNAFQDALDNQVNGIACCVTDGKAFNQVTDAALAQGIPVLAFNSDAPVGSGNNSMAYIGQNYYDAGALAASRALSYLHSGDTLVAVLAHDATPGDESRVAGAASVLRPGGVQLERLIVPPARNEAAAQLAVWYKQHPQTKFILGISGNTGRAVGQVMRELGLVTRGVRAAAFDTGPQVLADIASGHIEFTVGSQSYLQGFLPVLQLFLYNASGGLLWPASCDTGAKVVSRLNVLEYLRYQDTWEGSSTTAKVLTPPKRINLEGSGY